MASRPPKRRRRLIVLSSDDDEKSTTPDHHIQRKENSSINRANAKQINSQTTSVKVLPTRLRRKTRSLLSSKPCSTSSITKDPPSSVENVTRKRLHSEKKDKSASLYAYYGLTDFPQQSLVNPLPVENKPEAEVEPQDLIEDDSDDYFVQNPSSSQNPTRSVLDRRKKQPAPTQSQAFSECTQKFPRTRQKFIVQKEKDEEIPRPKQNKDRKFSSYNDMRPWAEKYGPNNMEELMVHKKKIADVKNWLEMFWQGQDQKVRTL